MLFYVVRFIFLSFIVLVMPVFTVEKKYSTKGKSAMLNITRDAEESVEKSRLDSGIMAIFVAGSTASVTTIEYEPGLLKDFPEALEKIAPYDKDYAHHKTWGDYNGASHVRASLLGPSLALPFKEGKLLLGTWQQIVLIDFDTHPRERTVVFQLVGD